MGKTFYLVTVWCDNKAAIDCFESDRSFELEIFYKTFEKIR